MRSRSRQSIRITRRSLREPTKLQRSVREPLNSNQRKPTAVKPVSTQTSQLGHSLQNIAVFSAHPSVQKAPTSSRKPAKVGKPRYGAVRLVNPLSYDLPYLYQWGTGAWKQKSLPAKGEQWHAWKYVGSQPFSPDFQVKFDSNLIRGKTDLKTYTLQKYQSGGSPHPKAKRYEFIPVSRNYLDLLPTERIQDKQWKQVEIKNEGLEKYSTAKIKGEAFVRGKDKEKKDKYDPHVINPNDVEQGYIANCYLLAAMASVARANPDAIQRLIRPKGNGVYDVTIYINPKPNAKPGEGPRTPILITVDDTFPASSEGKAVFAKEGDINAQNQPELWVMLIEKAYATYKGSYNSTAWGNPGEAMSMLTGNNSDTYYTAKFNDQQTAKIIDNALSKKLPVTASTPAMSETLKEEAEATQPGKKITEKHAYSVRGVDVKSLSIDLQNPWGGRYDVNGLPISKFRKFYEKYRIGR